MPVIEDLTEEERYLYAILQDESGLDQAEFLWHSPENTDGCFRAWAFQWCFAGDTRIVTKLGHRLIRDVVGPVTLLTESKGDRGKWVEAEVRHFGCQRIVEVDLVRYGVVKTMRTTAEHRWFAGEGRRRSRTYAECTTTELRAGMFLRSVHPPRSGQLSVAPHGVVHGLTWGDGTLEKNGGCHLNLWGEKLECARFLVGPGTPLNRDDVAVEGRSWSLLPRSYKEPVRFDESPSYLYGWLAGYFAADGSVAPDGTCQISSIDKSSIELVRDVCLRLGITVGETAEHEKIDSGYGPGSTISHVVTIRSSDLSQSFFLRSSHRANWNNRGRTHKSRDWKVVAVRVTDDVEDVYCAMVDGTHSFVLDGYILTSNCWWRNTHPLQIDQCARSVGKSLSIKVRMFAFPFLYPGQEAVITAPELVHLEPIVSLVERQFYDCRLGREMLPRGRSAVTHRPFQMNFSNGARIIGRIPQRDGKGVKGCVGEGTLIFAERGSVPVEDLRVGERVLTHKGRWRRVTHIVEDVNDCYEVKGQGSHPLVVSCDHRFLGAENEATSKQKRRLLPVGFHDVEFLLEHQVYWATPTEFESLPIPELVFRGTARRYDSKTEPFWWLVGRYLADGHLSMNVKTGKEHRVCWTSHPDDQRRIFASLAELGLTWCVTKRDHSSADSIATCSAAWHRWLAEHFGQHADGKRIPGFALGLPEDLRRALLEGYFSGDGHLNDARRRLEAGSASKPLIVGLQMLAQSLGFSVNCSAIDPKVSEICGVPLKEKPKTSWRMQVLRNGHPVRFDGCSVAKVWSVRPIGKRKIYNVVVEEDHSYVSNSIISHNVHPIWLELDEAQDYPEAGWTELIETLKRGFEGAVWRAHGVTRGVRDKFYEFTQERPDNDWTIHRYTAVHRPNWTDQERSEKIKQYGSRDHPDYRRNVLGLHGDATNPLFVLHRLMRCWLGSTLVETDEGKLRIDEVRPGQRVRNAVGWGEVARVLPSDHRRLVEFWANNEQFVCSPEHRVFTQRGWVEAEHLIPGDDLLTTDEVVRGVWGTHPQQQEQAVLWEKLHREVAWADFSRLGYREADLADLRVVRDELLQGLEAGAVLQRDLCCSVAWRAGTTATSAGMRVVQGDLRTGSDDEPVLHDVLPRQMGELEASEEGTAPWASQQGGSRRSASCAVLVVAGTRRNQGRLVSPVLGESSRCPRGRRDLVHYRYCQPIFDGGTGGRWAQSSVLGGAGSASGPVADRARVERVEVLERGDSRFARFSGGAGQVTLYDLTVTGHPSFAVGHQGLLSHNCCDTDETSDYNIDEYFHVNIKDEWLRDRGQDIVEVLDFPQRHKGYKGATFWAGMDVGFCADGETEMLTQRGWTRWDQVEVGDEALGINPATGQSEWQLVSDVYRERFGSILMTEMKGQSFDALVTPHHKWLVKSESGKWRWKQTRTLNTKDCVPLTVPRADVPLESVYSDDFVELVAWFQTEGWWVSKTSAAVGQSRVANPDNVDRIRRLLKGLCGEPGPAYIDGTREILHYWIEHENPNCQSDFHFRGPVVEALRTVVSEDKTPTMAFLQSLTAEQLRVFIQTSIDGDGWREHGKLKFEQRSESGVKALEIACALVGLPTSTSYEPVRQRWHLSVLQADTVRPVKAAQFPRKTDQAMTIRDVDYQGTIWCPTVTHGNWLARRNGSVYFTGNTNHPSEILVFVDHRPNGKDKPSQLKLLTRIHLERISHGDQVKAVLWTIDYYKPRAFALDKTGLGLPLFQDLQERATEHPGIQNALETIKGYGFSQKILVDFDQSVEVDEYRGNLIKDAGIERNVLEYASDRLRDLVDSNRLRLPWDTDLIAEFQGQTWTSIKGSQDLYGRRVYSKGKFHALDAARMAALGHAQYAIELMTKAEKFEPVLDTFVSF